MDVNVLHGWNKYVFEKFTFYILDAFCKLKKFSANCHLANDWSCFVEHKH